jgi:ubiquinone/menaquinone biosynthesis C-methylase UbiE
MTLPFTQASFPELYEQHLVPPLFRPFAEDIVQDLEIARGNDVLDIACGTGIVSRLAKKRAGDGGNVVGVDSNPQMLDVARRSDPSVDWRQGDASNLPVDETEKFDVVTCQQGIQFFPDRPAAMREMHRVLKDNGRLGVSAPKFSPGSATEPARSTSRSLQTSSLRAGRDGFL